MQEDLIEYTIEKLTRLLIEQDFADKEKGKATYIKKTRVYKDLISLLKNCLERG